MTHSPLLVKEWKAELNKPERNGDVGNEKDAICKTESTHMSSLTPSYILRTRTLATTQERHMGKETPTFQIYN